MNSRADMASRSRPSKMALPALARCRRSKVNPSVLLPEPDSPITPRVRPRGSTNDTSRTACSSRLPNQPSRRKKLLLRLSTTRTGAAPGGRGARSGCAWASSASPITGSRRGRASSRGRHSSSARVYGSAGAPSTWAAAPCSRISPWRITITWSAIWPTSPRSWVMNRIAIARRRCSAASNAMICCWIVTSSAVVGSSAMSSLGSQAMAMAIITRCCWPPDSWLG